jgi:hypothetical protein
MRFNILVMSEDESILYNLGVFEKHDDLIILPIH